MRIDKFTTRFHTMEQTLTTAGNPPGKASLDEMEAAWQAAKQS